MNKGGIKMFEKISKLWKSHVSTGAGDDLPFTLISEKTILDVNSLTGEHPVRVDGILKGDIDIVTVSHLGKPGLSMVILMLLAP
jgi:hypothetical protein